MGEGNREECVGMIEGNGIANFESRVKREIQINITSRMHKCEDLESRQIQGIK